MDFLHADELVTEAVTEAGSPVVGRQLSIPTPPVFDSVEEERAHRKAKLAAAFRMRVWTRASPGR